MSANPALNVSVRGFDVGRNVVARVLKANRHAEAPAHIADRATELEIEWHAEKSAALFPAMRAKLTIYPLAKERDAAPAHRRIRASGRHAFLDALARRMNDELC